ncbi:MAG: hypothetical protein HY744_13555 [Deltaproteobacteria bacterium]|nr:hypothetical protein [Deltaproteobacteria bacterium]
MHRAMLLVGVGMVGLGGGTAAAACGPSSDCEELGTCGPYDGSTGAGASASGGGGAAGGGGSGGGCASCDGACAKCEAGACVPLATGEPGKPSCAPYVCDGQATACPQSCSGEESCVPGHFCAADKSCKKKGELGESCADKAGCAGGFCVDGVCCNNACDNMCASCNVPGKEGTCAEVLKGKPDPGTCDGPAQACDGAAHCKLVLGQGCEVDAECVSGACADDVCCEKACATACHACNLSGSEGTCTEVPKNTEDPSASVPCEGTSACDGKGNCLLKDGQACNVPGQCLSGKCSGGKCQS